MAHAAKVMGLRHIVVTSVARDDLADGGAAVFAETIVRLRESVPDCSVEVLIPDFGGSRSALEQVMAARPDILNHNVETVPRLYRRVRPSARYYRSLELLQRAQGDGRLRPHQVGPDGGTGRDLGRDPGRPRRPAPRRLRYRHHRPVPAPDQRSAPPAGGEVLHAGRVPAPQGRGDWRWASGPWNRGRWCAAPITPATRWRSCAAHDERTRLRRPLAGADGVPGSLAPAAGAGRRSGPRG